MIDCEYKFIFIHIVKTGGTSIEKVLCNYLDIDMKNTRRNPQGKWWKHIWARDMKDYIGEKIWNDYFTFAFVRNPFDMILSLYSMYTQYGKYTKPEKSREWYHPWNQYKDFEDFILSMGECKHEPDEKWRVHLDRVGVKGTMDLWYGIENLQTSYLTNSRRGKENGQGKILVDFVGLYENLVADFHYFCEKVGLPKLDLIHSGATKHRPYQELYTDRMKDIVCDLFSLDIERFGYADTID